MKTWLQVTRYRLQVSGILGIQYLQHVTCNLQFPNTILCLQMFRGKAME